VDFWLDEDEFYEIVIVAGLGDIITGNYSVVDANVSAPIALLVLSSEHFSDWTNGSVYLFHLYRYSMSSEFSFPVPYADTWHIVFWNDSPTPVFMDEGLMSQLWIIIIGALGVVAAAIIVLIWFIRRSEDTEYVSRYDLPRSEGGIFLSPDSA
jgi:hypothetical protein